MVFEERAKRFILAFELCQLYGSRVGKIVDGKITEAHEQGDKDLVEAWLSIRQVALIAVALSDVELYQVH
ncbi:hypothetical protein [Sphingomonas sp. 22176]|uniref:hypothetical protein n=1 Tax=Sphingomonas sp. 22176 TaxID=3453884 RepID=UPI003F850BBD